MGAALTLVGAGIVFVVFFIPMATAGPPGQTKPGKGGKGSSGKNEVWWYEEEETGQVIQQVGPDQEFVIRGKNLNYTRNRPWGVLCWNGKFWTEVQSWSYGSTSRTLE